MTEQELFEELISLRAGLSVARAETLAIGAVTKGLCATLARLGEPFRTAVADAIEAAEEAAKKHPATELLSLDTLRRAVAVYRTSTFPPQHDAAAHL